MDSSVITYALCLYFHWFNLRTSIFNLIILSIAKMIQSFSSGVLFFTLLPKLFLNFPKQYRNVFLLMVIVGLFGSNALEDYLVVYH